MRLELGFDTTFAFVREAAETQRGYTPPTPITLPEPGPGDVIEVALTASTHPALVEASGRKGAEITLGSHGDLVLRFPNGGMIVLEGSRGLVPATGADAVVLLAELNDNDAAFSSLLSQSLSNPDSRDAVLVPSAGSRDDGESSDAFDDASVLQNSQASLSSQPATATDARLPGPLQALDRLSAETAQWGRDDLKRGEAGSQGETISVSTGASIDHLIGLGDEEPGQRNGEKLVSSDNARTATTTTSVGTSVDHLGLLGDFEYIRSSGDTDAFDRGPVHSSRTLYGTLIHGPLEFPAVEDTRFSERLFDPAEAILPVTDAVATMDPRFGTVVLRNDGSFTYTPLPGYSGTATFDFRFTDPRTGLVETGTVELTVAAVADPALIAGRAITPEDTRIATPITVDLQDTDGSEVIESVLISGVPTGATLAWDAATPATVQSLGNGTFRITGDTADILALLQTLTFDPPHDFSGRITLDVAVTTVEANADPLVPGYRDRVTVDYDYVIDVVPVADLPPVTGGAYTTDEDTPVALAGVAGSLTDIDGSEVLSFVLTGVPAGATFDRGSETAPGTWTFTPSDIAAGITFSPPPNAFGVFPMTLRATSTEQANFDDATNTAPIVVTVTPVPDAIDIVAPVVPTLEDVAVTFGDDISIVINDPDGSEVLSAVTLAGFPEGSVVTYTPVRGVSTWITVPPGGLTVQLTGGTEAEIRTALATVTLLPPPHSDRDIEITIAATTIDAGGPTRTETAIQTIRVAAVADVPTLTITGANAAPEDQSVPVAFRVGHADTADGSETIQRVEITGVPSGFTLTESATGSGVLDFDPGTGTYTVTGSIDADINDLLARLSLSIDPVGARRDLDTDFNLNVAVTTIESTPSEAGALQVDTLTRRETFLVPITVTPVPDLPTIGGSSTVDEDRTVGFGANITISANDATDGSERVSQVVLGNIPGSATVTYTAGGATVTSDTVGGIVTYTITGTDAQIRAAVASFTLQPATDSDVDINVSIDVTKTDNGVTGTQPGSHLITVAPVPDLPTIGGSSSVDEDQTVGFGANIMISANDATDGSERVSQVVLGNIPSSATVIYTAGGATVTLDTAGGIVTYTITGTDAQIRAAVASFTLRPATDSNQDIAVSVAVTKTDNGVSGTQPGSHLITVHSVVDTPAINSSSNVNEDGIVDVSLPPLVGNVASVGFGAVIRGGLVLGETAVGDTSEDITRIVITGVPPGTTIGVNGLPTGTINQGTPGQITITGASEAQIRQSLGLLTLIPPQHSDRNIALDVAVTVRDNDPNSVASTRTQTFSGTHTVLVAAVADAPTFSITGQNSGLEDQNIGIRFAVGHPDSADGSESIHEVLIDNVPSGFLLSESSVGLGQLAFDNILDLWRVTGPTDAAINDVLANLSLVFEVNGDRQHLDTDFDLLITVSSRETTASEAGAGEIARLDNTGTFVLPVGVTAVADTLNVSGLSIVVEDTARTIGAEIAYSLVDLDGSESVTEVVVSGFRAGTVVTYTPVGASDGLTFTATGTDTITLSGAEAAIRAALNTLTITAPGQSDANFDLTISATTTDHDGSEFTLDWQHAVTVQAFADAPSVASNAISGNEDTAIVLAIDANRSVDGQTDNSESLSVRVTLPQDGGTPIGTLFANGAVNNGVTVLHQGNGVYLIEAPSTGGAAAQENLLDAFLATGLSFQPRAQFSGSLTGGNGILVEAISTETGAEIAPDSLDAGDGSSRTEIASRRIDVTINPQLDTVTFNNSSTTVQENAGSSDPLDPPLTVPLGARLGITLADRDGSQSLDISLSNIPATAVSVFGSTSLAAGGSTTISGVTVSRSADGATISVTGANADTAITVLETLTLTLATDDDRNVLVGISGQTVESISGAISSFSSSHQIVVQAVADRPSVAISGSGDEDSFVATPIIVALNESDATETLQSVVVSGVPTETGGTGIADATPQAQFRLVNGAATQTFDGTFNGTFNGTDATGNSYTVAGNGAGQLTFTGSTAGIRSAVASLAIMRGDHNGNDFSLTVTATSIESGPTEAGDVAVLTAQTTVTQSIDVQPLTDPVSIVATNQVTEEDTLVRLNTTFVVTQTDRDGSEIMTYRVSGLPAGSAIVDQSGAAIGTTVAGVVSLTQVQFDAAFFRPPLHQHDDTGFSFTVTAETDETSNTASAFDDPVTAAATVTVRVSPEPDAPTISGSTSVNEDTTVNFGRNIAYALVDASDGSESITMVRIDQIPSLWTVSFVGGSMPASVSLSGGVYTITGTPAAIRSAVDAFQITPAPESDANVSVRVRVTTTDAAESHAAFLTDRDGDGDINTATTTTSHAITTLAVADAPTVTAGFTISGAGVDENTDIPLKTLTQSIVANRSVDTDGVADATGFGSEVLTVRISNVPFGASIVGNTSAGGSITQVSAGVFEVAAPNENQLNAILDTLAFRSADFSGSLQLTVTAITTETGPEIAVAQATDTDVIDLVVNPTVDTPAVKGNAVGLEDQLIDVPISVSLTDQDGSESYVMEIRNVPAGARLFGASGSEIFETAVGSGVYRLQPADVEAFQLLAPQHYSSALSGIINLQTTTIVTDTAGAVSVQQSFSTTIPVAVTGVADQPGSRSVNVISDEDQPIQIGASILAAAGGDLNSVRVDNDGSEVLSFVLRMLPDGVVPTSSVADGVIFIGNNTWQVSAAAVATLMLPSRPNFSGPNPYPELSIEAVTQEIDGSQSTSAPWPITMEVRPIINGATVDGLTGWVAATTATEDTPISLASIGTHNYIDNDGSERVISYAIDLSGLLDDARIRGALEDLEGPGATLEDFVSNYVNYTSGTLDFDAATGILTVLAADIGTVSFDSAPFVDSNVDFSVPVSALVRDSAIVGGSTRDVDRTQTTDFTVNLVGDADTPTAFASSVSGNSGARLAITLGGVSTDTDDALGRVDAGLGMNPSEDVYYIVSTLNGGTAPVYGFVDGAGNVRGLDNGDGNWLLTPSDLVGLHVVTLPGVTGLAQLRLTTIAVENDGDTATATADFTVTVTAATGPGTFPAPRPPVVTYGTNAGNEDGSITLNVTASPEVGDSTNPTVSVLISGVPAGTTILGARFNPNTLRWVASEDDINSGAVRIIPPADFSGPLPITIEAVAITSSLQRATTDADPYFVDVAPLADGVAIAGVPAVATEDLPALLNINLTARDVDGSESIGTDSYVKLDAGATLVGSYDVVAAGDGDEQIEGVSLVGYYRVPTADVAGLRFVSANHLHGAVTVDVAAFSVEALDSSEIRLDQSRFTVNVVASADAPIVTPPTAVPVNGTEDTAIALTGISAALRDTDGSEVLSVKISGVPEGSLFNAGSNNGDGSWTIPVISLSTLTILPPQNFAGTMTLAIEAFSLETSNGNTASSGATPFTVIVAPQADDVLVLAEDVTVSGNAVAPLDLNLRLADARGSLAGELAPEVVQITFAGVPTGAVFAVGSSGLIEDLGSGTWRFTGSEAEANALRIAPGATTAAGQYTVSVSMVTLDGSSTLATPVTDSFRLTVTAPGAAGQTLTGTSGANPLAGGEGNDSIDGLGGADTLSGAGGNDRITGGTGADVLTGGAGLDTFVWTTGQSGSNDRITDFSLTDDDRIDVSGLLSGFNDATSVLSQYLTATTVGSDTRIDVDVNGPTGGSSFTTLVVLTGQTGLNLDDMRNQGNLVV